jgi:hypothetical protein
MISGEMIVLIPIFCVVPKDGDHWQIEAEWPDGTIESVLTFKAGLKALDWVKTQSAAWVAERNASIDRRSAPVSDSSGPL